MSPRNNWVLGYQITSYQRIVLRLLIIPKVGRHPFTGLSSFRSLNHETHTVLVTSSDGDTVQQPTSFSSTSSSGIMLESGQCMESHSNRVDFLSWHFNCALAHIAQLRIDCEWGRRPEPLTHGLLVVLLKALPRRLSRIVLTKCEVTRTPLNCFYLAHIPLHSVSYVPLDPGAGLLLPTIFYQLYHLPLCKRLPLPNRTLSIPNPNPPTSLRQPTASFPLR
jgi:hypothetical protein